MPPPKNIQRQPQEVTPATYAAIRPGMSVVPVNPQEEEIINQAARQQGVNRAEAMKNIAEKLPPVPQKQTVTEQSLDRLERARELGLTSDDQTDPLNQVMRYGFYKDLKKDMKRGDEDRMTTREMMEMAILQRMLPPSDNGTQGGSMQFQQMMAEMKAENERNRQYYENKLKEQDEKIKDMIFEKRFRTMEETHTETVNNLSEQLSDVSQRLDLYRNVPSNASPAQAKDAITQLEELGGQIERIKKVMVPLGLIQSSSSPSVPSVPGIDMYKKADGTTDYFRYSVDKLEGTLGKAFEAWQKKTPDRKPVETTPPPDQARQAYQTQQPLAPEKYADILMSKASLTPEERQWLNTYTTYLNNLQAKVQPKAQRQTVSETPAPACRMCGSPAIYQDGLCELCLTKQTRPLEEQPKKGVIERLQEEEAKEMELTKGLV